GHTLRNAAAMRRLAQDSWNLAAIDAGYTSFVKRFSPLIKGYVKDANVSPKSAFMVRTLLIQEYRKVLLRDPQLPAELLPEGWTGAAAYRLCRNLYRAVFRPADAYLSATLETVDGPLPPVSGNFMQRFGGLE
ncbi:MAG: phenylacetic acid degradation operon negative regulatory protein PaaX, partial [Gammaproteobacteria bacterium]|nr:phenylacetic acid degradation operon negative regulatory protein PaaX [Gammaproteobacteria bacterium]